MKNIKKILINENATIKQALKIISKGAIQIGIVVNDKKKLVGTLSDGDIRRGFLNDLNLDSSIKSIIYKKPIIAKKNESKEKFLKNALSKNIYQIPIVDGKNKVIGIHLFDKFIKEENKSNKVVIMAGGRGMRLRPLTKDIPKPMLKVGDKPILQTIIEKFKQSGFKNFIICVNYKYKVITNFFGNGKKFGVKIQYVHEKKRLGTAGALSIIKEKINEPFFVINGDLLTTLNFGKMLNFHIEHNSKSTIAIKEHVINVTYGIVKIKNLDVLSINEKPNINYFVNAGIYLLDPNCIRFVPKNKKFDMPSLLKKIITKKYKTICFPIQEDWLDIGRLDDFKKAQSDHSQVI